MGHSFDFGSDIHNKLNIINGNNNSNNNKNNNIQMLYRVHEDSNSN